MRHFFFVAIFAALQINQFAFSQINQVINVPDEYRELEFRVTVFVNTQEPDKVGIGYFQLKSDGKPVNYKFSEVIRKKEESNDEWVQLQSFGVINKFCDSLNISVWHDKELEMPFGVDDFKVEVKIRENWVSLELLNGSFESNEALQGWTIWNGIDYSVDYKHAISGKQSLIFNRQDLLRYGHFTSHGHYVDVNGIRLYYEEYGKGEAVLLLHGNNQSISSMKYQIDFFKNKYRVIAVDSRGQGLSENNMEKMTYELMAEDMIALMNHLNIVSVKIIGWSDGGNTGLIMSMKDPNKVNQLATMGANLYPGKKAIDAKFWREYKWGVRIVSFLSIFNKEKWKIKKDVGRMPLKYPNIEPDDLSIISCPVLVMAGENDLILEEHTHLIANHINNSEIVILENAGHFAPEENHATFNKTIDEFFDVKKSSN